MENPDNGKKFNASLIILVLLGITAVATGYFLYFQPASPDQPPTEIAAKIIGNKDDQEPPQPKLQGTLSDDEKDTLNIGQGWNEFRNPFKDVSPRVDTLESLRGLSVPPVRTASVKTQPEDRIKEENLTSEQEDVAPQTSVRTVTDDTPASGMTSEDDVKTSTLSKQNQTNTQLRQTETMEPGTDTAVKAQQVGNQLNINYLSPESLMLDQPRDLKGKAGKVWVANVLSTQDPNKLRETYDSIMKEKIVVYAYETEVKGEKWYRIRIGFFNSKAEAQEAGREMAGKYGLPEPWIVKPGPQELSKYYNH